MVMDCLKIKNGNLYIDDCNTTVLAEKYGTPLYVFSETSIRNAMRSYKKSIEKYYAGNGNVLYASKAFSCKEMYRIAKDEGIFVDCVSMGEIYTAISADFNPEHIFFHGNNKTEEELKYAIKNGVGRIVIDNFDELNSVDEISKEYNEYKVCKINVDEENELASAFNVMSIPSLFVMTDGQVTNQAVGALTKAQILEMLK